MKNILTVLLLLPLALALTDNQTEICGIIDGDKIVFDCKLNGSPTNKIKSSVNPCDDFKSKIQKNPRIEVEVTLRGLENIDEFVQFVSEYRDNIKTLNLDLASFPKNFSTTHLTRVFALVPNLKQLALSWQNENGPSMAIDGHEEKFLPNLKNLYVSARCDINVLNFLSKYLTKDTLHKLEITVDKDYSPAVVTDFVKGQKNIKFLKISENPKSLEYFQVLKLEKLDFFFDDGDKNEQKKYLNIFLKTQPQLVDLNFLAGYPDLLDDKIFTEICNLENLTNFEFRLDGVSESKIGELKNLKSLKNVKFWSSVGLENIDKMKKMSKLEMPGVESIDFGMNNSSEVFEQFGKNYQNLKSIIVFGANHTLNFFMKTFPQLENLLLSEKPWTMDHGPKNQANKIEEIFQLHGLKYEKVKKLDLRFDFNSMGEIELLSQMLESFPNLEELKLIAPFNFTSESLRLFLKTKVKRISVSFFRVPCEEEYSSEKIEILKEFGRKFESVVLEIGNTMVHRIGGYELPCARLIDGNWEPQPEKKEKVEFIKELRKDFIIHENYVGWSHFVEVIGGTQINN